MSSIVNKVKNALHSDNHNEGAPEGTHGPHNTRTANAVDPRVDSDLDGSRQIGTSQRTAGHGEYGVGQGAVGQGAPEGTHGPHGSRLANAADPRIDSDLDGSKTMGGRSTGRGEYGAGQTENYTAGGAGTGFGNEYSTTGTGSTGMTGAGLGNEYSSTGTGSTGVGGAGYGNEFSSTGPGPAPNTAGPHKSDMMNKMDPRVDSDMDNSRTVGGNKTYQSGAGGLSKDPTDASQVPPSVLRQHLGDPSMEHEDVHHARERRNSVKTHQENFRGI